MQSLMDRITSLERVLNPVTQPGQLYRQQASKEFEQYPIQRPPIYLGSGTAVHIKLFIKKYSITTLMDVDFF